MINKRISSLLNIKNKCHPIIFDIAFGRFVKLSTYKTAFK